MMPTPLARTWAQDLWGSPWRAALSLGVFAFIAWLLWGGDAGKAWADAKAKKLG